MDNKIMFTLLYGCGYLKRLNCVNDKIMFRLLYGCGYLRMLLENVWGNQLGDLAEGSR